MSSDIEPRVEQTPAPQTRAPGNGRLRVVVASLLLALLVGTAVFAVMTWRSDRAAAAAQDDRAAAVAAAEQFTLRLDAVDYQDLDGYSKRLEQVLTPKMKGDFASSFKPFQQAYQAIQISSKGTVKAAGVEDIDADSATVLVIHDVTVTTKSCVQPPYKRMSVDLRKIHGRWLVDDFKEDVSGCQGAGSGSTSGAGQ